MTQKGLSCLQQWICTKLRGLMVEHGWAYLGSRANQGPVADEIFCDVTSVCEYQGRVASSLALSSPRIRDCEGAPDVAVRRQTLLTPRELSVMSADRKAELVRLIAEESWDRRHSRRRAPLKILQCCRRRPKLLAVSGMVVGLGCKSGGCRERFAVPPAYLCPQPRLSLRIEPC